MTDDFLHLAQQVRSQSDEFSDDASIVAVIESVLRARVDTQEPPATDTEVREKQDELREKITGKSREPDELESVDSEGLTEAERKQRELKHQMTGGN
jgi:hypothetical protein